VELRGRLSNPAVEALVQDVTQVAAGIRADRSDQATPSTPPLPPPRRWRLVDRLGEQIIRDLLRDSRTGITQRRLAERYEISTSSVKRLLRDDRLSRLRGSQG
jgi:DNA invertase Pin-like site-specific DNA recombinase